MIKEFDNWLEEQVKSIQELQIVSFKQGITLINFEDDEEELIY